MKTKHLLLTLLALFASITASAYTWTDENGTEWYFTVSYGTVKLGNGSDAACRGTIPTSLTIPSTVYNGTTAYTVNSIASYAFNNCSSLTAITIPEGVTSIGDRAFQYCSSLTSITIPKSVTSIGNYTFAFCNLQTIVVEENNNKYDSRDDCNAIIEKATNTLLIGCKNTIIPESVTSIGNNAFYGCTSLTAITIPESITSIGENAFYYCPSLAAITIPESITSIGNYAFQGCNLQTIVVDESNEIYDSRDDCNAIIETATNTLRLGCKNTIIPNSVTSIGFGAFYGCPRLTAITIPNSITSIGESAFAGCI